MRKATKLYAERKRAQGYHIEKDTREDVANKSEPVQLINITVDERGVKIDHAKATSSTPSGMGGRKNSRSRMTRASSRQRIGRSEDKENMGAEHGQRPQDTESDAFFSRKRGPMESWRKRDSFSENGGSWDGSMPKRHSSRSFIQHNKERRQTISAKPMPNASTTPEVTQDTKTQEDTTTSERLQHQLIKTETPLNTQQSHVMSTPAKETPRDPSAEEKNTSSPTISNVTESCTSNESNPKETALASVEIQGPRGSSSLVTERNVGPPSSQLPLHGKWCDNCAGIGLHIAALLSEMEKRATLEVGSENPNSTAKKGWKNIVLGDSKSKSSSEKARLQQEIKLLRSTVEFLVNKIDSM